MSEAFRKDGSSRTKEDVTPNSYKSTQQKLKESIVNSTDRTGRGAQSGGAHSKTAGNAGDKSKGGVAMNKR